MVEGGERSVAHPGESLKAEIRALGISPTALARRLGVPASRITDIINRRRGISADSALRLARYFGAPRRASGWSCRPPTTSPAPSAGAGPTSDARSSCCSRCARHAAGSAAEPAVLPSPDDPCTARLTN